MQVRYLGLVEKLKELMVDPVYSLNAAVYTELSDVEAEINGLITYDRQVGLHTTPHCQSSSHCQGRLFGPHTKGLQWCRLLAGDTLWSVCCQS